MNARLNDPNQENLSDESDNASGRDSSPGIESIASGLVHEMPEVQQHAIDHAAAEADSAQNLDADGTNFDASIHSVGTDGNGKRTAKGLWAKRRGRGASSAKAGIAGGSSLHIPGRIDEAKPTAEILARSSGVGAANLFLAFGIIIGGDEWQPRINDEINEKAMVEQAFGDYFVATGKTDLPPGWALVACLGMYVAPRFTMPKTRSRFSRAKDWVVVKYVRWKLRRKNFSPEQVDKIVEARTNGN